jgi:FkbM family methyltransferase
MTSAPREAAVNLAASIASLVPAAAVRRAPAAQLWLNRALKRHPRVFRAAPTSAGFTVDGHTSDLIQRYLYVFGVWEPDITHWLTEHLRPGDVVVDIGANIGYFSLLAATCVGPTGKVLAFEPVPSIADLLTANVQRNDLAVDVHRVVVGDAVGSTEIFRSAGTNIGRSGTSGGAGTVSEGSVPVVRAADAIDKELWERIRFIKIDVEGDERRVLRGLEPLLAALSPDAAVFVEVTPSDLEARGESADELMATMRGLGFEALAVPNSYKAEQYARYTRQHPTPLRETPRSQTDVIFVRKQP